MRRIRTGTIGLVTTGSPSAAEATIALLTATAVAPLAGGDPIRYVALTGGLALVAGVLLMLAGLARLGFVTRYLSRPLLVGYVTGSAIIMIVSQLDSLFGIKLEAADDTVAELLETIRRLPEAQLTSTVVGVAVIAVVLVVRRLDRRLPAYLIAVAGAIAASVLLDLADHGVATVGAITQGLPPLGLPDLHPGDLGALVGPAFAIALLAYADTGVTGQVLGRRGGYRVDADGEFFGLGAANIAASLTGGFPVNGSQSRSFTAADTGARSQVYGLIVVVLVLVTLVVLTPLFEPLPKAALAGVIIVVALGLLDLGEFRRLARIDRKDAGLAVLATAIVVIVGMLVGVVAIVLLSLLIVAQEVSQPRMAALVRVPGTAAFRSADTASGGEPIPGLLIFRFDAPLFFANASLLRDEIEALVAAAEPPVTRVILNAEAITSIDSTGEGILQELLETLTARQVTFGLARVKAPVMEFLERTGLSDAIGRGHIYLGIEEAVRDFRDANQGGGVGPDPGGGGPLSG